ncbi:AraC-like DNA-binding protein [Methylobacterium sp. RAS18]|nr:AraC-like DNA-binding protein [Methylobacterium sp. RAS18]
MIVEHRFAHIPQDARRGRAWIASHASLAEAYLHPAATVPLAAYLRYQHLGNSVLGVFEAPAQTTERTEALVLRQGLDHIVLRTQSRGRARISVEGMNGEAGLGDIILLDLGRPYRIEAEPATGVELFLPRRVLAEGEYWIPVRHGRILVAGGHPLIRMVADHLGHLAACLSAFPPVPAVHVVPATLGLCRALLTAVAERGDDAPSDLPGIAIRRFIEENLTTVEIATLMDRFGLSHRALYRLFPQGGVAAFIRDRRLVHAMQALSRSRDERPRKLAQLSHACGFANPRVFSRAFHRKFGIWPADVPMGLARPGEGTAPRHPWHGCESCRPVASEGFGEKRP